MAQQVIIQQPAGMQQWYPQDMREWDTGICGCAEDCGICKLFYTFKLTNDFFFIALQIN